MEDKFSVIIVERAGTFNDNENSMFAVDPESKTKIRPATQAESRYISPLSLAGLFKAEAVGAVCQTAPRSHGRVKTELTIETGGALVQRALY